MASTKIPKVSPVAGLYFSGRPFLFGDFFFGPAKKKLLGRGSGRRPALSGDHQSRWIPAFAGMTAMLVATVKSHGIGFG
jgi:hypothetical protein